MKVGKKYYTYVQFSSSCTLLGFLKEVKHAVHLFLRNCYINKGHRHDSFNQWFTQVLFL